MRFCNKTTMACLLSLIAFHVPLELKAQGYVIEEISEEGVATSKPFSISRAVPFDGGLRLFLGAGDPEAIAELLNGGSLEAEVSDHEAENSTTVPLSLGKAVWFSADANPIYLAFRDPLPLRFGYPPERIEYFLEAPVALGPEQDLTIGKDPDFLWIIEER